MSLPEDLFWYFVDNSPPHVDSCLCGYINLDNICVKLACNCSSAKCAYHTQTLVDNALSAMVTITGREEDYATFWRDDIRLIMGPLLSPLYRTSSKLPTRCV